MSIKTMCHKTLGIQKDLAFLKATFFNNIFNADRLTVQRTVKKNRAVRLYRLRLPSQISDITLRLNRQLQTHIALLGLAGKSGEKVIIDESVIDNLKALGYMQWVSCLICIARISAKKEKHADETWQ